MPRTIRFNAFDMNCIGHQSPGLWKHPDDHARDYNTLQYWTNLAQLLEHGKFDGLFIADVLGTYDVFNGDHDAALRSASQVPVNDPALIISAMAAVTENLGFGLTASTAYEHPYPFSRRLATLDHLTNGRIGWNVVTGYLASAARNMGETDQLPHDQRYDRADEYLDVVYKLLEGSWEDDAVVADLETGVFTDPDKIHPIEHHGTYFDVPGIALTEPSSQRTPVIFQAGASPRGLAFAAKHAEATFINGSNIELIRRQVKATRDALEAVGRPRDAIKIYSMQTIITGATDEEAQAKYEDYKRYVDHEGALALMSGWTGFDLSSYGLDEPISTIESNAIQSSVAAIGSGAGSADGQAWTVRELAEWVGIGGFGPIIVGSGATVAEELIRIQEETDVDGFNLAYVITPGTFEDIVEYVVPELQARGRYQTDYAPGTLRNKLHGDGDRLPDSHHASDFKITKEPAHV